MIASLAALPIAAQLFVTVADTVPTFDVTPSCRAAASVTGASQDRLQTCMQSEQRARDLIVKHWDQFTAADRRNCALTASVGGSPTYTEMVTCLEMARDTRNPPQTETLAPMQGPSTSGMVHRQPRPAQPPGTAQQE
jgi:hypothetical protein